MLQKYYRQWALRSLVLGILVPILTTLPAYGSEKIILIYGGLNFSIPVKSLERFVQNGTVDHSLKFYFRFLNAQQKANLQEFLRTRYAVKTFALHQLGQTYAGEQLLTTLGKGIQIPGGRNGHYAIRGSMIQASATPEGLSVINVIRHFPTDIQLNITYLLASTKHIFSLVQDTQHFMKSLPQTEVINSTKTISILPSLDLEKTDVFKISKKVFSLHDYKRNRQLKIAFYFPKTEQSKFPVIVISNGLGAHLDRFSKLAEHLASHGFAVIIADHPNSNDERQNAFYAGLYSEPFDATEFVDRPLDVTFILDQFEKLNSTQFDHKLNLQEVGILGYSFGGATAFALAGAKINFQQLEKDCKSPNGFYNISILYQCRALELPQKSYDLKDQRIKAIFAFFPFSRSLYGQSEMNQIKIPVFWQATDADVITPLLTEQVPPFTWLQSRDKYLAIAEKLPHTRIILNATSKLINQQITEEQIIQTTHHYLSTLSLAFFKTYIAHNNLYYSHLQPPYILSISQEPFRLHLTQKVQFSVNKK
jgi:predicted dienelactone hydrolase